MVENDWKRVKEIYQEGIATKNATFATTAPAFEEWDREHVSACRYVAKENGRVIGWVALSPVSGRCIYRGVAEVSIYIEKASVGKGIGKILINHLVVKSEAAGFWTLQAGIFPENKASLSLHQYAGFRVVGTRERIGKMDGKWRDVVLLERRSNQVGRA